MSNETVAFQSMAYSKFVKADTNEGGVLKAELAQADGHEQFVIEDLGTPPSAPPDHSISQEIQDGLRDSRNPSRFVALKNVNIGDYVRVDDGSENNLEATRGEVGRLEQFLLVDYSTSAQERFALYSLGINHWVHVKDSDQGHKLAAVVNRNSTLGATDVFIEYQV